MLSLPTSVSPKFVRRFLYLFCLVLSVLTAFPAFVERKVTERAAATSATSNWYRGNTHSHTLNSDGDSSPTAVAVAYKSLGYNFLFITDHNKLTSVDAINEQLGVPGQFVVLKGEEVTDSFNGAPVHLIGLNNSSVVATQGGTDVVSTIQNDVDAIKMAGGVAVVAHPNYHFALTNNDLKSFTGTPLFEVYNAHPTVNNAGDATHSSVENKWDDALSSGKLLYGVAADDEHTLTIPGGALPGRAWVMVRATSLDADSILQAMMNGDFYASTGITLQDYQTSSSGITITVNENASGPTTIDFIGRNGQLLQRNTTSPAVYSFTGHEQYVRAKVVGTYGQAAWTQPIYTERLSPADAILNGASVGNDALTPRIVAPDSIALASGVGLASGAIQAQRQADGSFPTSLAGTVVTVNGLPAELFYVSSTQVCFHVPAETELGTAEVLLTNADGIRMLSEISIAAAAPGVFAQDGKGQGNAVVFDLDNLFGSILMPDSSSRRFYVYATGVIGATNVQVKVNGQPVIVEAVKSCRRLPGLDQITIVLPRDMTGSGDSTLVIQADGVASNATILHL